MNSNKPKILAFSGSARAASFNKQLIALASVAATTAGAEVTRVDLRDYSMPIYDGDDEAVSGIPPAAARFRQLLASHDGFLIASPEHNGSVTALLKNILDWSSRPASGVDGLVLFRGKPAGLMSASVSPYGGIRSVAHLRGILSKMGTNVLADEVLVTGAQNAFDAEGRLTNKLSESLIEQLAANLVAQSRRSLQS